MSSTGKPAGIGAALERRDPRRRTGPGTATAAGSAGSPRPRRGSSRGRRATSATGRGAARTARRRCRRASSRSRRRRRRGASAKPAISASSRPVSSPSPRSTVTCVRREQHVVARVAALLHGELVEVDARRSRTACSSSGVGSIWPGSRWRLDVEPVADLLAVALGHAEHARDHLDRERRGEVGDGVELGRVVQRVEEAADDLADHRLERRDGRGA